MRAELNHARSLFFSCALFCVLIPGRWAGAGEAVQPGTGSTGYVEWISVHQKERYVHHEWPLFFGGAQVYRSWLRSSLGDTKEKRAAAYRVDLLGLEALAWGKFCHWAKAQEVLSEALELGEGLSPDPQTEVQRIQNTLKLMHRYPEVASLRRGQAQVDGPFYHHRLFWRVKPNQLQNLGLSDHLRVQVTDQCSQDAGP